MADDDPQTGELQEEVAVDDAAHRARVYDYLSKTESLSWDDLHNLQESINALKFNAGTPDGFAGKDTAAGVIEFLSHPENRDLVTQIGNPVRDMLNRYGQSEALTRLTIQEEMDPEIFYATQNTIYGLLQTEPLTQDQMTDLQTHLNTLGYPAGNPDGIMGKNTASGIMGFLKDNPNDLLKVTPEILRDMIKYGQGEELRALAQKVEAFDERITAQLDDMGNLDDASYQDVYKLQTLLNVGGYKPGGIDGIVGGLTRGAVSRYEIANHFVELPEPRPTDEAERTFKFVGPDGEIVEITPTAGEPTVGTNEYGVSLNAIERVWATLGENEVPPRGNTNADTAQTNPRPLIVIDLGHGSDIGSNDVIDPGAESKHIKGLNEVGIVDSVGKALADRLHALGYQVAFTRNNGEQLRLEGDYKGTLEVRPQFAHQIARDMGANGVVFLSLHADAAKDTRARGATMYVQGSDGNAENPNSLDLANTLKQNYSLRRGTRTRVHEADYSVLRNFEEELPDPIEGDPKPDNVSASVLIELGYLSNNRDARALNTIMQSPENKANDLATAINSYVIAHVPELQAGGTQLSTNPDQSATEDRDTGFSRPTMPDLK